MKPLFLGSLVLAISFVGLYSQEGYKLQPAQRKIQPVIVNQIVSQDGTPLVEIFQAKCDGTPMRLESCSWRVRNNSDKKITAMALVWTFVWSDGHSEHSENIYRFSDLVLLKGESAGLAPGNETSVQYIEPPRVEGNEFVKSIRASLDYVEFTDKSSLGPDHSGAARRFAITRAGARAYRDWLLDIYQQRGPKAVVEELRKEHVDNFVQLPGQLTTSPDLVKGDNSLFMNGATRYRIWLLNQVYKKEGPDAVIQKLLSPPITR